MFYIAEGDGKVPVRKDGVLFLLEKHTGFTCVFFFYPNKSIPNSSKILYKLVTLFVYSLHPLGTYVIIVKEGQR